MSSAVGSAASSGSPEPRVRRVVDADLSEYRRIRLDSLATDPLAFGSTLAREQEFPESTWIDRVHGAAQDDDRAAWVAEAAPGRLVALVGYFPDREELVAVMMWVDPAFRGRGLGRQLFDALLAGARSARPSWRVRLEVNPAQRAAMHLYRSRGFRATGVRRPLPHTPEVLVEEMVLEPAGSSSLPPP